MNTARTKVMACLLIAVGLTHQSHAQTVTQTINLVAGWNAVYLEVDPEPNSASATVFTSSPFAADSVERVAMWADSESSAQFISDPGQLTPESSGWLLYFASNQFPSAQPTLTNLLGGRAYLIKIKAGSPAINWTLTGTARLRPTTWKPDSYNLTGFSVATPGPTFNTWFSGSTAHAGNPVYQMATDGKWQSVNLASDLIVRGKAYWVMTKGSSDYQGPIRLIAEQGGVLDFGPNTSELSFTLKNESSTASAAIVLSSVTVAGSTAVPLSYWNPDVPNEQFTWTTLSGNWNLTLLPREERLLRLRVSRPATPAGARLHNLLRIDSATLKQRLDLPVYAYIVDQPREGLWVGDVVINAVSEHTAEWNSIGYLPKAPTTPKPVGREFNYRIIVHVDDNGVPRLLGQAVLLWKTPSEPVVLASESRIKEYMDKLSGLSAPMGRRFTAPIFPLSEPLGNPPDTQRFPATGATSSISFTVSLDHQDARNPFKHKYHPDHDNLQGDFVSPQTTEGIESYSITRTITMAFTTQHPEGRETPGWGDTELGGTFTETVQGLMKDQIDLVVGPGTDLKDNKITATGYFLLRKVSDVDTLDPAF